MINITPILSSPVTFVDWLWNYGPQIGTREQAVRTILERCKRLGWTRLYWRCFDGGRANYLSDLVEHVSIGFDADSYHAWLSPGKAMPDIFTPLAGFDDLAVAVDIGHELGLEIHAWVTINEDDHAWGVSSRFSREHPQFRWMRRTTMPYNSQLSFAYDEVREYKLALIDEILAYDIDGVFFDWIRTGDVRNNPQTDADGVGDFGYEPPLVEAFKQQHGLGPQKIPNGDPRWIACRAEPISTFVREACEHIKGKDERLVISAMVQHPWGYRGQPDDTPYAGSLEGLFCDIARWSKQGWVDELTPAGYYRNDGSAEKALHWLREQTDDRCGYWLYQWVPANPAEYQAGLDLARQVNAPQVFYWESDYIAQSATRDYVTAIDPRA